MALFFGVISAYHSNVCCLTIFQDLIKWNKEYGVGTLWHMAIRTKALGKSSDFISVRLDPMGTITASTELGVFGNASSICIDGSSMECQIIVNCSVGSGSMSWECVCSGCR